jgi:hypothetical protein
MIRKRRNRPFLQDFGLGYFVNVALEKCFGPRKTGCWPHKPQVVGSLRGRATSCLIDVVLIS